MSSNSNTILIVDDSPSNLQLLSQFLESEGYNIKLTLSGKFVLKFVQKVIPDLILLDINMPDMDGFEVCQQLKSMPETQYIPIIFISAYNNVSDRIKALEVGGIDYISKPLHTGEVVIRIKNILNLYNQYQKILEENTQLTRQINEYKKLQPGE